MKFKNKKTGEIAELGYIANSDGWIILQDANTEEFIAKYNSLAELNEEWEDYEEPEIQLSGIQNITCGGTTVYRLCHVRRSPASRKKIKGLETVERFWLWVCTRRLFYPKFVVPDAWKITSVEEQKALRDDYKLLFGGEE